MVYDITQCHPLFRAADHTMWKKAFCWNWMVTYK